MRNKDEEKLQRECVKWFDEDFNKCQTKGLLFHIPNGGARNPIEGKNLKLMGVRAGMPDLQYVFNGTCIFIELKIDTNDLSDTQSDIIWHLRQYGFFAKVVKSLGDFQRQISVIYNYLLKEIGQVEGLIPRTPEELLAFKKGVYDSLPPQIEKAQINEVAIMYNIRPLVLKNMLSDPKYFKRIKGGYQKTDKK